MTLFNGLVVKHSANLCLFHNWKGKAKYLCFCIMIFINLCFGNLMINICCKCLSKEPQAVPITKLNQTLKQGSIATIWQSTSIKSTRYCTFRTKNFVKETGKRLNIPWDLSKRVNLYTTFT